MFYAIVAIAVIRTMTICAFWITLSNKKSTICKFPILVTNASVVYHRGMFDAIKAIAGTGAITSSFAYWMTNSCEIRASWSTEHTVALTVAKFIFVCIRDTLKAVDLPWSATSKANWVTILDHVE